MRACSPQTQFFFSASADCRGQVEGPEGPSPGHHVCCHPAGPEPRGRTPLIPGITGAGSEQVASGIVAEQQGAGSEQVAQCLAQLQSRRVELCGKAGQGETKDEQGRAEPNIGRQIMFRQAGRGAEMDWQGARLRHAG